MVADLVLAFTLVDWHPSFNHVELAVMIAGLVLVFTSTGRHLN